MTSYVGMWISIPPSGEADGLSARRHTLSSFKLCFTGDFADHLSTCSSCPMSLIKNLMIQSLLLYMVKSSLSAFQIWIIYSQMWPRPWHVLKALQVMLIFKKGRNHRSRKHFSLEEKIFNSCQNGSGSLPLNLYSHRHTLHWRGTQVSPAIIIGCRRTYG